MVKRWALMIGGLFVVLLGILIAPLPGPGGIPVIAVGLVLILKSSYWAKRQFIRAQRARPTWHMLVLASVWSLANDVKSSTSSNCAAATFMRSKSSAGGAAHDKPDAKGVRPRWT